MAWGLHRSAIAVCLVYFREIDPTAFWEFLQHYRHETDMPTLLRNVRSQGQSGKHLLALSFSGFDQDCVKTPSML